MSTLRKGIFVVLEGPECSGKSTQREHIAKRFRDRGYNVILTREPGGTPFAEKIRELTKKPSEEPISNMTELLLMYASRAQHIAELIKPHLDRGAVVISDRFEDSSWAYQHYARGMSADTLEALSKLVVGDLVPDLTLFLMISPNTLLERKNLSREVPDRFDDEKLEFLERVIAGYETILVKNRLLKYNRRKIIRVDAEKSLQEVSDFIDLTLDAFMGTRESL